MKTSQTRSVGSPPVHRAGAAAGCVIEPYAPDMIDHVVEFLGDAFVTNPLHIAVFGAGELERNRRFFRIGIENMFKSIACVARLDGKLCGYAHFGHWPSCLGSAEDVEHAGRTFLAPLGDAAPRVVEWLTAWSRWDPQEPHGHLGPIGVAPHAQGKGVGKALMKHYVLQLEANGLPGYLETDRPGNVGFYAKFGFTVQREEPLIGTPMWTMWRPSPGDRSA